MKNLLFSIVICTHNRAELARAAIQSVLAQDFPHDQYELLLVDNASTDHTAPMAQEFCDQSPQVRYIFESAIGLSHARNCGWQVARGEYIGYLDDDATAVLGWLAAAFDVVVRLQPLAFGGPYRACYNTPKPAWFNDSYGSKFLGVQPRPLKPDEYLAGGNMFIRRDVLVALGGFNPAFGMQGNKLAYGEETRFFKRLRAEYSNGILYYHPEILIDHLVRPEKFQVRNIFSSGFGRGRDEYLLKLVETDAPFSATGADLLRIGLKTFLGISAIVWRDRQKYPYYMNYLYEEIRLVPYILGRNYARWFLAKR